MNDKDTNEWSDSKKGGHVNASHRPSSGKRMRLSDGEKTGAPGPKGQSKYFF